MAVIIAIGHHQATKTASSYSTSIQAGNIYHLTSLFQLNLQGIRLIALIILSHNYEQYLVASPCADLPFCMRWFTLRYFAKNVRESKYIYQRLPMIPREQPSIRSTTSSAAFPLNPRFVSERAVSSGSLRHPQRYISVEAHIESDRLLSRTLRDLCLEFNGKARAPERPLQRMKQSNCSVRHAIALHSCHPAIQTRHSGSFRF